ncbi:hypothetical protein [Kitasatospora sp. NPDC090308]|uniref:hypothetical protein n=1 Tax=Kitasatospora sp. NPDC090308 TaxID=3364082 RepID=UPI0037FCFEB1
MPHDRNQLQLQLQDQNQGQDQDRRPDAEQRAARRAALVARIRAANAETLERLAEL